MFLNIWQFKNSKCLIILLASSILSYSCTNNQEQHDVSYEYYKDGTIKSKTPLKDGKKNGEHISYYSNGEIKSAIPFKDDSVNGIIKNYDSLGRLLEEYQMKRNIRDGYYKKYYPNGKIEFEGRFKNNKAEGSAVEYYEDSQIFRKYYFVDDTIFYFKGYDKEGYYYDSKLPIKVEKTDNSKLLVELLYSEYDSVRIGLILGPLDETKHLIKEEKVIGSKNSKILIDIDKANNHVTGILYEIKLPEEKVTGEYYFEYKDN